MSSLLYIFFDGTGALKIVIKALSCYVFPMENDKKPRPVDLNEIDLETLKLKSADVPSLLEYAHSVGGFSIVPTNEGSIKSHAKVAMQEQTEEQLNLIFEQMKTLAKQVQDIKKRVHISELIYEAKISFTPVIGKNYFLYEYIETQERFLSLISPEEWCDKMKDKNFLAEVRLNADHTWKIIKSTIEIG